MKSSGHTPGSDDTADVRAWRHDSGGTGYHGVNYNTHLKTEGIEYISDKTRGVNIHSCLAVMCDGLVLGVLDQSGYNRKELKNKSADRDSRKVRPIEEKESFRWLEALKRSTADLPPDIKVITVCDREGNMAD